MRILILALLALLLTACGGSGGSSNSSTSSSSSSSSSSFTVTAIDGYLSSAEVYLDRNGDGIAGSDELVGSTDINGQIVLDSANKAYPVIIRAVAGITYDSDYTDPISENYEMVSAAGNTVVTPFTTLSYIYDIPMDEVVKKLDPDGSLGLDVDTISGDYVAIDTDVGVVTQALARSVAGVFEDEIANNMDTGLPTTDTLDSYVDSIVTTLDTQVAAASHIANDLNETVITVQTNSEGIVIPTTTSTTAINSASSGSSGSGSSDSGSSGSGSSGSGSTDSGSTVTEAPLAITNLRLSVSGEDEFEFRWNDAEGATYYNLWESIDGIADGTLVGAGIDPSDEGDDTPYYYKTTIADRLNAQYLIQSCNDIGCAASAPILVSDFYTPPVVITEFQLSFSQTKSFDFAWPATDGTTHYKLMENVDGNSGFIQVGENIASNTLTYSHIVPLYNRMNAQYMLQSCIDNNCTDSEIISVNDNLAASVGYFKASNTGQSDRFGYSLDLSKDGNTLAVGARYENSNATGINGDQASTSALYSGAVYIFTKNNVGTWTQEAYIKASNTEFGDEFGYQLTLSATGDTLAVGAYREDSISKGINGDQANNDSENSGAVYVFTRNSGIWVQEAYIKPSNTNTYDFFGSSLGISADGNTLAVGAYLQDSSSSGVNGDQTFVSNISAAYGAVYIFTRSNTEWSQHSFVKASNASRNDDFGFSVALSSDGNTLAVGAKNEGSNATGINGNQTDDSIPEAGAVYVFTRGVDDIWSQQAYVKPSNTDSRDKFGISIALSEDGSTMAVGTTDEKSSTIGLNGNQTDNSLSYAGAVYIFTRDSSQNWSQQAYVKASNTRSYAQFGKSLDLSSDGNTLAIGSHIESSNSTGINENQSDTSIPTAGAAYVFSRIDSTWTQKAYIKASNTEGDYFGISVALSSDAKTLAVGAAYEDSNSTGINGEQTNNDSWSSGAVYLY